MKGYDLIQTNMKHAFKLPYSLFLITGLLVIILSFFHSAETIDIHVHDTYYVIAENFIFLALALFFLFFWIAYSAGRTVIYKKSLVWLHFILTALSALFILSCILYGYRYYSLDIGVKRYMNKMNHVIILATLVLIFAQLIFLVNMIIGLIRKLAGMDNLG